MCFVLPAIVDGPPPGFCDTQSSRELLCFDGRLHPRLALVWMRRSESYVAWLDLPSNRSRSVVLGVWRALDCSQTGTFAVKGPRGGDEPDNKYDRGVVYHFRCFHRGVAFRFFPLAHPVYFPGESRVAAARNGVNIAPIRKIRDLRNKKNYLVYVL